MGTIASIFGLAMFALIVWFAMTAAGSMAF